MSFFVVIPARFSSTRLPGKPLLEIAGKPMIQHVYERACESEAKRVIIATDDQRIADVATSFGAETVMTKATHPSGTDRLEEVVTKLGFYADDIVVNVQGDEPLIPPRVINQVAHNLSAEQEATIATLCERIEKPEDLFNPNVVKVVFDAKGRAMYFSRAPIPWSRQQFASVWSDQGVRELNLAESNYYRHIGIYAYRVKLLRAFVQWAPAPTEVTESLEQLRAMYNGERIHVDVADVAPPPGVDTLEDLEHVRNVFNASKNQQG